jgi:hypothetical protein
MLVKDTGQEEGLLNCIENYSSVAQAIYYMSAKYTNSDFN